jgi:hypothetical protein
MTASEVYRMFGYKAHGPAGEREISRRDFVATSVGFLGSLFVLGLLRRSFLKPKPDFYTKALQNRDFSGGSATAYKMVPLPGHKYDKAETSHMANKIFPSIEAARARCPHRGFQYALKAVPLPRSLVNGMDEYTLFCHRKDFDRRVRRDLHHWQNLGLDVNAVFGVVATA